MALLFLFQVQFAGCYDLQAVTNKTPSPPNAEQGSIRKVGIGPLPWAIENGALHVRTLWPMA